MSFKFPIGRSGDPWTSAEDCTLIAYYPQGAQAAREQLRSRSVTAIVRRAAILGVKVDRRTLPAPTTEREPGWRVWTPEDDAVIIRDYPIGGAIECVATLVHRTPSSIVQRANVLGVCGPRARVLSPAAIVIQPPKEQPSLQSLQNALEEFKRADRKAVDAIAERARKSRAYAQLRAKVLIDGNHQRRVS